MANNVELPVDDGKALIARTAMSIGYSDDLAGVLAQSAWWLENRSLPGVSLAITYMLLTRDIDFQTRKRIKLPQGGQRIYSPVWAGLLYCQILDFTKTNAQPIAIYGPVAPLLMASLVVFKAAEFQKAVRLRYLNMDMVLAKSGIWINKSEGKDTLLWLDPDAEKVTTVQLVGIDTLDESGRSYSYKKVDTLKFPKFRLRGEGILYLGD